MFDRVLHEEGKIVGIFSRVGDLMRLDRNPALMLLFLSFTALFESQPRYHSADVNPPACILLNKGSDT